MSRIRVRLDTPNGLVELPPGSYVVGRAPECDIVVTTRLASRQHARLTVGESQATIEDLGTPNGSFVNGAPLTLPHVLADADFIVIGGVVLEVAIETLHASAPASALGPRGAMEHARSPKSLPPQAGVTPGPPQHLATIPAKAYEVLAATADPFFTREQLPLAEKILEGWLTQVLTAVKTGAPREVDGDGAALRQAARLAGALVSARWVDHCLELATELSWPLGETELDALEPAVRQAGVAGRILDGYLVRLRALPAQEAALAALARVERWRAYAAPR